jgi:antitoxin component HigA of HigAB toxin-antitoxin module
MSEALVNRAWGLSVGRLASAHAQSATTSRYSISAAIQHSTMDGGQRSAADRIQNRSARPEEQIRELLAMDNRTPPHEAYLTLLSGLVERWESKHVVVPVVHGVELVKALLVERQLRQKDLLPVFGTESMLSEVLSLERGPRPLGCCDAVGNGRMPTWYSGSPTVSGAPAARFW